MHPNTSPDLFDAFLATRHGKFVVSCVSFILGITFLFLSRIVSLNKDRPLQHQRIRAAANEYLVNKYAATATRDGLSLFGSTALMLGLVYLVWSLIADR